MNKLFARFTIILLTIFSIIISSASSNAQDVIPNADFEQWAGGEPDSWNTSNMMILFTQFTTVTRETSNPQSGSSCAKISTVTQNVFPIGSVSIPGILTLGELNIDYIGQTASLTGGTPFTGVPQALTGFYKYQPTALDSCFLGFGLFRWKEGRRDTIGYAYTTIGSATTAWTPFEVGLNYDIWEAPDTMNIVFLASNALDGLPHGGTKLWVDNLSLVYGNVSIEGITFPSELKIYANGAKHLLIIRPYLKQQQLVDMDIFDMAGQLRIHQSCSMQNTELTLDIAYLHPGTYVFRANIPGEKPFTRKFTVLY
jgi:hypothetical protein